MRQHEMDVTGKKSLKAYENVHTTYRDMKTLGFTGWLSLPKPERIMGLDS